MINPYLQLIISARWIRESDGRGIWSRPHGTEHRGGGTRPTDCVVLRSYVQLVIFIFDVPGASEARHQNVAEPESLRFGFVLFEFLDSLAQARVFFFE
jgi:hypothetical protein